MDKSFYRMLGYMPWDIRAEYYFLEDLSINLKLGSINDPHYDIFGLGSFPLKYSIDFKCSYGLPENLSIGAGVTQIFKGKTTEFQFDTIKIGFKDTDTPVYVDYENLTILNAILQYNIVTRDEFNIFVELKYCYPLKKNWYTYDDSSNELTDNGKKELEQKFKTDGFIISGGLMFNIF